MSIKTFEKWLIENDDKTENTAYSYKNAIPKLSKHFSEQTNTNTNLEDLEIEKLKEICEYYTQTGKYADFGENSKGTNRNALIAFVRYKVYLNSNTNFIQEKHSLKNEFLSFWSQERVKNMTLNEYTNLNRVDSFCYWLESKTTDLGSIWGGSSYKFGIYKRSDKSTVVDADNRKTDGEYAWFTKYGDNKEEAFKSVKKNILKVINYAKNNYLESIDNIDLGFAYKWKIAFLYSNFKIINIFKYNALKFLAIENGYDQERNQPTSDYQKFLINLKLEDEDYFSFTQKLWNRFEASKRVIQPELLEQKNQFIKYLKNNSLDIEIAEELESLSVDVISKGYFNKSIYECISYYDVIQLQFQNPIRDNWNNMYEYYFSFIIYQIKHNTSIDLNLYYSLVTANNEKEYTDFIKKGFWSSKGKNVYSGYVSKFKKGSKLALYNSKGIEEITVFAIGTIVEDFEDDNYIKVNWDNNFEAYNSTLTSNIGTLDFYEIEPEKADYKFNDIKNVFYKLKPMETNNSKLNQILYGPPGTGKTYKTKALAVEIIDGFTPKNREELTDRYFELMESGQIYFTTFHQSMSYEDFIEGIKPKMNEENSGDIEYEIKSGLFKEICEIATSKETTNFKEAYENLIKDISDSEKDYLVLKTPREKEFRINVNSNDNLSLYTSSEIKKQGVLSKNKLERQYQGDIMFKGWEGYASSVLQYLEKKYNLSRTTKQKNQNYVLIIDEINRGNVSAIFGELITLIETDKRAGQKEAISATLPYSKTKLSVPDNVYIIGTMNTADRSVEALDTALRRRFSFEEIVPKPELLSSLDYKEVDLEKLLKVINQRIELLIDKDHQIGHSYFFNIKNFEDLKLVFKDKIIPLLEEYFYGDFGKIGLVLGKNFIEQQNVKNKSILAPFQNYDDLDFVTDKKIFRLKPIDNLEVLDFVSVYQKVES